jgi:hypothetical protein
MKVKPCLNNKAAETSIVFRKEQTFEYADIRAYPVGPTAKNDALQPYLLAHCKEDAFRIVVSDPKRGVIGFYGKVFR